MAEDMMNSLVAILRRFQARTPGVVGSAVISTDGFTIASELPMSIEEERMAAMAAAMLALGEQATQEFDQGKLKRIFVEGERGHIIVVNAGPDALISAIARPDAKLGMVLLQMHRAADHVRQAMSE